LLFEVGGDTAPSVFWNKKKSRGLIILGERLIGAVNALMNEQRTQRNILMPTLRGEFLNQLTVLDVSKCAVVLCLKPQPYRPTLFGRTVAKRGSQLLCAFSVP
jgi:hypothetical protein